MHDYSFSNGRFTENVFVRVQFDEAIYDSLWPNGAPFLPVNWTSSTSWPDCLVLTADKLWNRVNCSSTALSLCSRIGRSIKRAKMDVTYIRCTQKGWHVRYIRCTTGPGGGVSHTLDIPLIHIRYRSGTVNSKFHLN